MSTPAWLLTTKLYFPSTRANRVPRPRLIARLNENKPLTLIAALQTLQPKAGATALTLLQPTPPSPPKTTLTTLINDLSALTTPLALVLDDYHVITSQPIHDALTFLLDHLPPQLRLVILSRADPPLPLARLRARSQLTEIRADDLRFTPEEAAAFLQEVMGLKLSANDSATLESRTEGWIAGLQLAALSMQGRADVSGFIQAFSGSHRRVLGYLVEEVLERSPAGALNFLLQTSILDRLCGPLCDAVTRGADGHAHLGARRRHRPGYEP